MSLNNNTTSTTNQDYSRLLQIRITQVE